MPLVEDLIKTYRSEQTTSSIYVEDLVKQPRILLTSSWLSELKMIDLLKPDPSLLAAEDKRFGEENHTLPYLCNFVQGLKLGNSIFGFFDQTVSGFKDHVSKLKGVVEESNFVLQNGVEELLLKSAYDPSERITDVVDGDGRSYTYSQKIRKLGNMFAYEVYVNSSDRTTLSVTNNGYRLVVPRMMPSDYKCNRHYGALAILFRQNEEGVGYDIDHFMLTRFLDYTLYISAQRIESKNTKNHYCYEHIEDGSYCVNDCLDKEIPCDCDAMFYGESKTAKIFNVSNMCHKLQPLREQCQLVRPIFHPDIADRCRETCYRGCQRTSFYGQSYARKFENLTHQYIDIHLIGGTGRFHVKEFFAYNIISLTCALGAIASLFFGYSFISIFNAVETVYHKIIGRGCTRM